MSEFAMWSIHKKVQAGWWKVVVCLQHWLKSRVPKCIWRHQFQTRFLYACNSKSFSRTSHDSTEHKLCTLRRSRWGSIASPDRDSTNSSETWKTVSKLSRSIGLFGNTNAASRGILSVSFSATTTLNKCDGTATSLSPITYKQNTQCVLCSMYESQCKKL